MGVKVRLELDADTQRLTDTIQKAVAKGFKGGGTSGLASDPSDLIRQIMGGAPQKARASSLAPEWFLAQAASKANAMGSLFQTPSTKLMPDWFLSQGAKQLSGMGSLVKGGMMAPDWFLKQGAERLSGMGELFPKKQNAMLGFLAKGGAPTTGAAFESLAAGAAVGGIIAAAVAALALLVSAIKRTVAAYDDARKLYAHSLTSGLGLSFTASRGNLADVLGVSEKDVFQFGAAVAILSPKLKWASDTMARTAPNLTSVAWEFEILKKNLEAMFFTLANDAAPALRMFTAALSELVKGVTGAVQGLFGFLRGHENLIKTLVAAGGGGPLIQQLVGALISSTGSNIGAAPNPQGMMKQLPASAWEHMGLVVGGFGGGDYARRTAVGIEKLVSLAKQNANAVSTGGTFFDPLASNP